MLKKKTLWLIVFSLLLMPGMALAKDLQRNHPALKLMHLYSREMKGREIVNAYIINIIAIYELSNERHYQEVKDYIEWFFNHLNYPDKYGLTSTIYDYEISMSGDEKSTLEYDSVDGYAGTFLYLVNLYHLRTGDKTLINRYWDKIRDIAYLIPYLQMPDGLTIALRQDKDNTKYLMDNCEAYAGLMAFQKLARRAGKKSDLRYANTAEIIRKSVLKNMYDEKRENFYWALDDKTRHTSDWSVLYPDAFAQIFPIYFGLLDKDKNRVKILWQTFNKKYNSETKGFALEQRMLYELTKEKMDKWMNSGR